MFHHVSFYSIYCGTTAGGSVWEVKLIYFSLTCDSMIFAYKNGESWFHSVALFPVCLFKHSSIYKMQSREDRSIHVHWGQFYHGTRGPVGNTGFSYWSKTIMKVSSPPHHSAKNVFDPSAQEWKVCPSLDRSVTLIAAFKSKGRKQMVHLRHFIKSRNVTCEAD